MTRDLSEPLKRSNNRFDMAMTRFKCTHVGGYGLALARKRLGYEVHVDGHAGFYVRLQGKRPGKAAPGHFDFWFARPEGRGLNGARVDEPLAGRYEHLPCWKRSPECTELAVLVGIREPLNKPKRVTARVWLSLVRLQPCDLRKTRSYFFQWPVFLRCLAVGGQNTASEGALAFEYRKVTLFRWPESARYGELLDYVVECTPEIVYSVTEDDPEARFRHLVADEEHGAPTGLWINLGLPDSDGVQASLVNNEVAFGLESFQVFTRADQLGFAAGQLEAQTPHRRAPVPDALGYSQTSYRQVALDPEPVPDRGAA